MRRFLDKFNFFYWLRSHTINQYHLVDCRSKRNDYTWGWIDRDRLMLFACFQILVDFIEKELPNSNTDYSLGGWKEAKEEMEALYKWWTVDRNPRANSQDEDDEMLLRLMKVRGFMWT